MSKGSDIANKLIVAGLLFASMLFFANIQETDDFIVPGVLFAIAGLVGFWLISRREARPAADLDLERRVVELSERLAASQAELGTVEERLERLTQEQDFMRQLAGRQAVPRVPAPLARPAEVPPQPVAPELSPPPR